ncbi:MAG: hypothetical protein MK132_15980 [Lentisphaerales bacterium]|nr:hypothetical protein [Lentisphaerales bacterium]
MKSERLLLILNIFLFPVLLYLGLRGGNDGCQDETNKNEMVVSVKKNSGQSLKVDKEKEEKRRKERLSARFFLPIPGERNSLSDLVDGMVIENINKRVPAAASFKKLLKEENPEISEEDLKAKVAVFNEIVSLYLQDLYKIQRGLLEGDSGQSLVELKSSLFSQLQMGEVRFNRLLELEKGAKTKRQLAVFEKLLVKDDDKLSEEQRGKLNEVLLEKQTTPFEELKSIDEPYQTSDELLQSVQHILKPDQAEHFKYFQEYHWHSNDLPEVNDLPRLF